MKGRRDNSREMTIRTATIEDIPQILPLWRQLSDMHSDIEPMFKIVENAEEKFAEYLNLILTKEQFFIFVATENAEVAGYVIITLSTTPEIFVLKRRMYIQDMIVSPKHRRKGVGKKLMDAVMAVAEDKPIEKMDMLVAVKNEKGNEFWKAMGFKPALTYMTKYLA